MAELLQRMILGGVPDPAKGNVLECSFALEYNGPPVTYDIPRAVPIDIQHIPTAAIVVPSLLADHLDVPVVHPLPSPDPPKAGSGVVVPDGESIVSPTSVIAFDHTIVNPHSCELSHGGSSTSLVEVDITDSTGFPEVSNQSCDVSGNIGSSYVSEVLASRDESGDLSFGSLGMVEFSNGTLISEQFHCSGPFSSERDLSRGLSSECGISGVLGCSKGLRESLDFSNGADAPDWISSASAETSPSLSFANSSGKGEEICNVTTTTSSRRDSLVTLQHDGPNTGEAVVAPDQAKIIRERKESSNKANKWSCHRCLRGNRFTEKELCIVCNARYCTTCVLRAMGSMPEGRKCLTCIGSPIDESKRGSLGKCSRMLKRLLSSLEIQQVMTAEKLCEVNQLQPEHVFVNGKCLCQEEMTLLQRSPNPPKLNPGRYWYDKVSGFWGKEGHKPCRIICAHLNVGGILMGNASKGNTEVFINNREITKAELRMLQWAGVQCAGKPHFWVNADGSYQEEGQKNIRGNIWGKAGVRLLCSVLALPLPPRGGNNFQEEVNDQIKIIPQYLQQRMLQKFLLVGSCGCGTSTIFKQAKFLYSAIPFTDEERANIKFIIQSCVYRYLGMLLEGRERFEEASLMEAKKCTTLSKPVGSAEEVAEGDQRSLYSVNPRLKEFSDWLLKVMASGSLEAIFPAATREYAPIVEELWKDPAVQATYKRRRELQMLPNHASYFLERVVNISKAEYEPSDMDILHAEGVTSSNGLTCINFSFPHNSNSQTLPCGDTADSSEQFGQVMRYELIRVSAKDLGENCKLVEMFEDVRIVIFCVALSDYDQFYEKEGGAHENKMLLNKKLFQSIIVHPTFEEVTFLLVLNKFDLLEQKIIQVPLTVCGWFGDFHPVVSRHYNSSSGCNSINGTSKGQQAFHYVAVKFKKLYHSLTGRNLYVCRANGLDASSVDAALRYAKEIVKWEEEKAFFSENSVFSTDDSSSQ